MFCDKRLRVRFVSALWSWMWGSWVKLTKATLCVSLLFSQKAFFVDISCIFFFFLWNIFSIWVEVIKLQVSQHISFLSSCLFSACEIHSPFSFSFSPLNYSIFICWLLQSGDERSVFSVWWGLDDLEVECDRWTCGSCCLILRTRWSRVSHWHPPHSRIRTISRLHQHPPQSIQHSFWVSSLPLLLLLLLLSNIFHSHIVFVFLFRFYLPNVILRIVLSLVEGVLITLHFLPVFQTTALHFRTLQHTSTVSFLTKSASLSLFFNLSISFLSFSNLQTDSRLFFFSCDSEEFPTSCGSFHWYKSFFGSLQSLISSNLIASMYTFRSCYSLLLFDFFVFVWLILLNGSEEVEERENVEVAYRTNTTVGWILQHLVKVLGMNIYHRLRLLLGSLHLFGHALLIRSSLQAKLLYIFHFTFCSFQFVCLFVCCVIVYDG